MEERVAVTVSAFDPVSEAGLASQLRSRQEVLLVTAEAALVTIVVVERVDDRAAQAIRTVQRNGSRAVVVVTEIDSAAVLAAIEAGCCGLVRRAEATPDRLVAVVRAAAEGNGTLPPDLLGRLMDQVARLRRPAPAPAGSALNPREVRVLRLVADGRPTYDIARELSYSERTVKNILHDVTNRLQLRNRAHAVAYALREGLI